MDRKDIEPFVGKTIILETDFRSRNMGGSYALFTVESLEGNHIVIDHKHEYLLYTKDIYEGTSFTLDKIKSIRESGESMLNIERWLRGNDQRFFKPFPGKCVCNMRDLLMRGCKCGGK